ncbi:GGDEF domain-containing protein [Agaribacterium haliotis]|uniref:GGDEF domain-containing protein n=1 Tax=Agaribacterium haliotis TaxID=2013869 RepID=UPI000BB54317|nr:GGDEF domain-containing protein [Agaribacterium haliotis]
MMKFSIRTKLFLSHFLAIVFVSGSIGSFFFVSAMAQLTNSLQSRLKHSAALLAQSFDGSKLDNILASSGRNSADYQFYLNEIRDLAEANSDIAFIYVMQQDGSTVRFVLDSDIEAPATVGEIYNENISALQSGFSKLSVDKEITHDRWGSFMSGYAPIAGGTSPYLVGIDMRADTFANKLVDLRNKGIASLVLSIIFAYAFAHVLSRNMLSRIDNLHRRCASLAPLKENAVKNTGDELDHLSTAFNYLLDHMSQTQNELEQQVQHRTAELRDSHNKLEQEVSERRRMEVVLKECARTDYLTKLVNRREMTNRLQHAINIYKEYYIPFCVILVDVDRFKSINDEFGHDIGDQVLKDFSFSLKSLVREEDTVARWGGEEFLILMSDCEREAAVRQAEKIRLALNTRKFNCGDKPLIISASFGVAEYFPQHSLEFTLKQADLALLRAKQQGRNRVLMAELGYA